MEALYKVRLEDQKTTSDGITKFRNLPSGRYIVEVQGNEMYQSAYKVITVLNEEDNDTVKVYVGLRLRIDTDAEFHF